MFSIRATHFVWVTIYGNVQTLIFVCKNLEWQATANRRNPLFKNRCPGLTYTAWSENQIFI